MKLNTNTRKRFRVSNKVKKVASKDRFRLCISRSSKNNSAQIIDDLNKVTLLSASSVEKDIRSGEKVNKTELSKIVAAKLAKKAQEKKITKIYFDRGIYRYHGRVKVFAENPNLRPPFTTLVIRLMWTNFSKISSVFLSLKFSIIKIPFHFHVKFQQILSLFRDIYKYLYQSTFL